VVVVDVAITSETVQIMTPSQSIHPKFAFVPGVNRSCTLTHKCFQSPSVQPHHHVMPVEPECLGLVSLPRPLSLYDEVTTCKFVLLY
jgi:hypothetical protein